MIQSLPNEFTDSMSKAEQYSDNDFERVTSGLGSSENRGGQTDSENTCPLADS